MGFLQMTQNMSEKEFKNLRKLFIKIDKDMDGRITSEELKNYFEINRNSLAL